jgi:hypothetical protein
MKTLVVLAGALALASGAQAATYDAFASFNGTQGAGGFNYVKLPSAPGVLPTPLSPSSGCVVTSDFCLQDGPGLPGVYKSLTEFEEGTYTVPDDRLLLHPGVASAVGVFFNAPEAGVYDYAVNFSILDDSPSGVFLIGVTNASGAPVSELLGPLNSQNPTRSRSGSVTLAQGQFLAFIVNNGGSYSNDSTGFNFTLTSAAVPEPSAWALMILGFGGAGAALRGRSRRAAA